MERPVTSDSRLVSWTGQEALINTEANMSTPSGRCTSRQTCQIAGKKRSLFPRVEFKPFRSKHSRTVSF